MQAEYEAILKSGMFWVIFPNMTGEWNKDMPDFIEFITNREANKTNHEY